MAKSLSQVFIERPRLAYVAAIVASLCGAFCLARMPVSEYPNIAPVTVTVQATYLGASTDDLRESVANVIEDQINGVENIWYYQSACNDGGQYVCNCRFRPGTPSDMALVNVQNAVKRAEPKLPTEVVQHGVSVDKAPEDRMVMYAFTTDGRKMDLSELSNFVEKQIAEAVARIDGVARVDTDGSEYSMRIWLDPVRLANMGLSMDDIRSAIEQQNVQAAAGAVGSEYSSRTLTYKIKTRGRLKTKEEFEGVVVRSDPDSGAVVRLRDVAKVELGAQSYARSFRFNDVPGVGLSVYKTPDSNAIATASRVKSEVERWAALLPDGVTCDVADDTTAFTVEFLKDMVKTLAAAFVLVVLITWLFLQDWRSTVVPAVAIPISLLGTFLVLQPVGSTLNVLTMFALILVIGSLVDNAIVVVENTHAIMSGEGLSAKEAASKSMGQVTGAIVSSTLVSLACYVPLAFYSGMTGMMYVQFAVTMGVALVFSALVSIVLSPAICAHLLRPSGGGRLRAALFLPFNAVLDCSRRLYLVVASMFAGRALATLAAVAVMGAAAWLFARGIPTTFLPKEDRGYITGRMRLSEGQTLERTIAAADEFQRRAGAIPGVKSVATCCGDGLSWGKGENMATFTIQLDGWGCRKSSEMGVDAIMERLKDEADTLCRAEFVFAQPSAISALGGSSAVGFRICGYAAPDAVEMLATADEFVAALSTNALVKEAYHVFTAGTPQIELRLDRDKAESLGLTPKAVFQTLQGKLASFYVNDFNLKGGIYQVKMQNEPESRGAVNDILNVTIASPSGEEVPLSSVAEIVYRAGAREIASFNKMASVYVEAVPKDGVETSEVMEVVRSVPLPDGYAIEWGPIQMQEAENEGKLKWLVAAAFLFAYLFLVAQYESWLLPVGVMLSVVVALAGAFFGLRAAGLPLSIYAQLGCVMLIGLAAKNAILMMEFSRQEEASGLPTVEAAMSGAGRRYRAVMMTAWSFVIGTMPLVFASGAGSQSSRAIGVCTCSGMFAATVFGIALVPGLYTVFHPKINRKECAK